jgi:hypothetical protein
LLGDLDVDTGIGELGEVAAHGSFACADRFCDLVHPPSALEATKRIEDAKRSRDLTEVTLAVHAERPG